MILGLFKHIRLFEKIFKPYPMIPQFLILRISCWTSATRLLNDRLTMLTYSMYWTLYGRILVHTFVNDTAARLFEHAHSSKDGARTQCTMYWMQYLLSRLWSWWNRGELLLAPRVWRMYKDCKCSRASMCELFWWTGASALPWGFLPIITVVLQGWCISFPETNL